MPRNVDYKADLLADLRDDLGFAGEYLSAAYADSREAFLVALRDVAEAQKGIARVAAQAKVNRENLYRTLSKEGNPTLYTIGSVLDVLGLKVLIVPQGVALPVDGRSDSIETISQNAVLTRGTKDISEATSITSSVWNIGQVTSASGGFNLSLGAAPASTGISALKTASQQKILPPDAQLSEQPVMV